MGSVLRGTKIRAPCANQWSAADVHDTVKTASGAKCGTELCGVPCDCTSPPHPTAPHRTPPLHTAAHRRCTTPRCATSRPGTWVLQHARLRRSGTPPTRARAWPSTPSPCTCRCRPPEARLVCFLPFWGPHFLPRFVVVVVRLWSSGRATNGFTLFGRSWISTCVCPRSLLTSSPSSPLNTHHTHHCLRRDHHHHRRRPRRARRRWVTRRHPTRPGARMATAASRASSIRSARHSPRRACPLLCTSWRRHQTHVLAHLLKGSTRVLSTPVPSKSNCA